MTAPRDLLLDFGGVLYAILFERWDPALIALAGPGGRERVLAGDVAALNRAFEAGELSPDAFRMALRTTLASTASDAALDGAWNALLAGPLPGVASVLRELAARHRLFLVSNTNAIHHAAFAPECADFFPLFERRFLSFELHARKPDAAYFERVLAEAGLDRARCLFVDDSAENVEGARRVGLPTHAWERNADPRRLLAAIDAFEAG